MAIDRVLVPTPTAPTTISDYQAILAQGFAMGQSFTLREPVDGSTIPEGTVLYIGGVLYKATSDTSITGSSSAYVKITPAGATASAAFVANLTGVSWNKAYGGYYDGSGNLYLFDESLAYSTGVIASIKQSTSRLIRGERVISSTLNGDRVVDATINNSKLVNSTITAAKIANETITTTQLNPVNRTVYYHYGESSNISLPQISVGETAIVWIVNSISGGIQLPATGTFDHITYRQDGVQIFTDTSGSTAVLGSSIYSMCIMYRRTA